MSLVQQLATEPDSEQHELSHTALDPVYVPPRRSHSVGSRRTRNTKSGKLAAEWLDLDTGAHRIEPREFLTFKSVYNHANELQLIDAKLAKYMNFIDSSLSRAHMCSTKLDAANALLDRINLLSHQINSIVSETKLFEKTCHDLVTERDLLQGQSKEIDSTLHIFNNLDVVTRQLHAPGTSLAGRRTAFAEILTCIDFAMAFFDKHPDYLDSEFYKTRYSQCLGRALAMSRDFFCTRIKEKAEYVQKRSKSFKHADMGSATHLALIYANFEGDSSLMKAVTEDIRCRSSYANIAGHNELVDQSNSINLFSLYGDSYDSLYESCFKTYLAIRSRILAPYIAQNFADTAEKPFLECCWGNISFFRELYRQEWELYKLFFHAFEPFSAWVSDTGEQLQDALRRRIIREQSIESLCELTSLLLDLVGNGTDNDFVPQFRPILEDVQSRLVFRVQSLIENDIIRYVPKSDDFAEGSRKNDNKSNGSVVEGKKADSTNEAETPLALVSYSWYGPLRRSVMLLSQIYQLVNSHVFDDLAHRIVHECLASLERAKMVGSSRLGPMEAQLFLIRNLLLLQTQIVEFDIGFVPPELQFDFSAIQDLFSSIRSQGVSFGVESLLNLARATVPRVVSNMFDAKQELYARLRNAVHDFTEECIKKIAAPLLDGVSLDNALEASAQFRQNAKEELPRINSVMDNYIDDIRTRNILMDSIQDLMIQTYATFHADVVKRAQQANSSSDLLNELMDVDGLVAWLGVVVGQHHTQISSPVVPSDEKNSDE